MCPQFFFLNDFLCIYVLKEIAWHDTINEKAKSELIICELFYNILRMYLNQELVKRVL